MSLTFHLLSVFAQIPVLSPIVYFVLSFAGRPPQIALVGPSRALRESYCGGIFNSEAIAGNKIQNALLCCVALCRVGSCFTSPYVGVSVFCNVRQAWTQRKDAWFTWRSAFFFFFWCCTLLLVFRVHGHLVHDRRSIHGSEQFPQVRVAQRVSEWVEGVVAHARHITLRRPE